MIRQGYYSPVGETWRTGYSATGWYDSNPYLTVYIIPGSTRYSVHPGIDLQLPGNKDALKPVYAIADGVVLFAGRAPRSTFGNVVVIQHERCASRYAHLNDLRVAKGDLVRGGEQIAVISKTGMEYVQFGEHLHFDICVTDLFKSQPLHWPGNNTSQVIAHYVDPTRFLLNPKHIGVVVKTSALRIRTQPSITAPVFGRLTHNSLVYISREQGDWLQLDSGYFVHRDYVMY